MKDKAKDAFIYKYMPMFLKREAEDCYDYAFGSWMSVELKSVLRSGTAFARQSLPLRYISGSEMMDMGPEEFPKPRGTPDWMIAVPDSVPVPE